MAPIDRISLSFFLGQTSSVAGSGKGSISSSRGLSSRLNGVETSFSRSAQRLNAAFQGTSVTKESLDSLLTISGELIELAEEASKKSTSNSRRKTLNRQFQDKLGDFQTVLNDADSRGVDLLDVEDLTEVFQNAGLDTANVSNIATALARIAGSDGELGIDPIQSRTVRVTQQVKKRRDTNINVGQTEVRNDGTFNAPTSTTAGGGILNNLTADFDNDGNLDLVQSTVGVGFTVQSGNGDGSFNAANTFAGTPSSFATDALAVDLDGDNNLDILAIENSSIAFFKGNGDGTFNDATDTAIGDQATAVTTGDFNNDGELDVAVSSGLFSNQQMNIFLGDGAGGFAAAMTFSTGIAVNDSLSEDFDNDGVADLLIEKNGSIEFLKGNNDGTFNAAVVLENDGSGSEIIASDLNNDGRMDFLATNPSTDSVLFYNANGDGTFLAPTTIAVGNATALIELSDLNGDGNLDLITNTTSPDELLISFGNGDGSFNNATTLIVTGAATPTALSIGDINNDGGSDIFIANGVINHLFLANTQTVNVDDYVGNTTYTRESGSAGTGGGDQNGEFTAQTEYDTTNAPTSVELYDITGDGVLDLVTADRGGGTGEVISVQVGNGDGTFLMAASFDAGGIVQDVSGGDDFDGDSNGDLISAYTTNIGDRTFDAASSYATSDNVRDVELYDVNGDGNLDLITADLGSGTTNAIGVQLGNNDGSFNAVTSFATIYAPQDIVGGFDLDGDGNQDLIVAGQSTNGVLEFLAGNGDGSFAVGTTITPTNRGVGSLSLRDINGDGNQDLIATVRGDGEALVLLGNSDGTFNQAITYSVDGAATDVTLADVNGDSSLDLLVSSTQNGGEVAVFYGNGDGNFQTARTEGDGTFQGRITQNSNLNISVVNTSVSGDFNNDGNIDVIIAGINGADLFLGNGNGTFQAASTITTPWRVRYSNQADINNDGNLDLIVRRGAAGSAPSAILLGNGDGTFRAAQELDGTANGGESLNSIRDFDGDGNLDILAIQSEGNDITFRKGNGDGTFDAKVVQDADINGQQFVGDFNGDGLLDLAGDNSILFGNGDGTFQAEQDLGVTDISAIADFNNDGHLDIAALSSSGDSIIITGNGDGSFKAPQTFNSPDNDFRYAEDINGDGNLDLISRITGGSGNQIAISFGNGDGTFANFATYNAGNIDSINISDFNNDGVLDIVQGFSGGVGDGFNLLLGNSQTVATGVSTFAVGPGPEEIAAGDIDGDGNSDIVTLSTGDSSVSVLYGNGDGSFDLEQRYDTGLTDTSNVNDLELSDIDNDTVLDIVISGVGITTTAGDGSFNAPTTLLGSTAIGAPDAIASGDFDGDGNIDYVLAGSNTGGTSYFDLVRGNGDGTFLAATTLDTAYNGTTFIQARDIDDDGNLDLISLASNNITIHLGNSDGSFDTSLTFSVGSSSTNFELADIDNDGNLDLINSSTSGSRSIQVYTGNGDGTFNAAITSDNNFGHASVAVGDLDNDGNLDVVSGERIYLGNGDGTFDNYTTSTWLNQLSDSVLVDIDADGNIDVVSNNLFGEVEVALGQGDGTVLLNSSNGSNGGNGGQVSVQDINGDGNLDIVSSGSAGSIDIFIANGDGSFSFDRFTSSNVHGQSNLTAFTLNDFDNDGGIDIIQTFDDSDNGAKLLLANTQTTYTGAVSTLYGNGDKSFVAPNLLGGDTEYQGLAIGDLDGDGVNDLVGADNTNSEVDVFLGNSDAVGAIGLLSGNGNGSFDATSLISVVGSDIEQIIVRDIDGDGNSDIVTANGTSGSASVFMGNGDGTFQAGVTYITGGTATDVALADIDGDTELDLLISESGSDIVNIFYGNGDGSFDTTGPGGRQNSVNMGSDTYRVRSADIDGDGNNDIITIDEGDDTFSIAYGNGDGTFNNRISYGTDQVGLTAIEISDLNADGNLDVVVSSSTKGTAILFGNGDRTFEVPLGFGETNNMQDIALGDVDGNSTTDIATADFTSTQVDVFLGNTSPVTATGSIYQTGDTPVELAAGDINGDGNIDLVTADSLDGTLSILTGNGDATFNERTTFTLGGNPSTVELVDLNNDGNLDIIATSGTNVYTVTGNGDGTFNAVQTYTGISADDITTGDFNNDGNLDVAIKQNNQGDYYSILNGNGDGTLRARQNYFSGLGVGGDHSITTADLNGDGSLDIIQGGTNGGQVRVSLNDGDGTFGAAQVYDGSVNVSDVVAADVNSDGVLDIVTSSEDDGRVRILYGNGDGSFQSAISYYAGSSVTDIEVVDVNEDGTVDILAADETNDKLSVLVGNIDGTFSAPRTYNVSGGPIDIVSADFNNDGVQDAAILSQDTNSIDIYTGNPTQILTGDASFNTPTSFSGKSYYEVQLSDLNQDGILDAVASDPTDGSISIFLGNNDGSFSAPINEGIGVTTEVRIEDVNNDGIKDIVSGIRNRDTVGVFLGVGDGTVGGLNEYNVGDKPVDIQLRDLNSDGDVDIVSVNENDGTVSVLISNGDGSFLEDVTYTAQSGATSVELLDVNGDGNLDIVTGSDTSSGLYVATGNSDGTFNLSSLLDNTNGIKVRDLKTTDLNGDGNADLVALTSTSAQVFLGNGNALGKAEEYDLGYNLQKLALGDIDGDGATDIVASNQTSNSVKVLRGYTDGTFQQEVVAVDAGSETYGIALGDINNDEALDIVTTSIADNTLISLLANTEERQEQAREDVTLLEEETVGDVANPTSTNPLDRNIGSRANAIVSTETFEELVEVIEEDLSGISDVLETLQIVNDAARAGLQAAQDLQSFAGNFGTAEQLANEIRDRVLQSSSTEALNAYGEFNTILIRDLLRS